MKILDKLERQFGRFYIPNLTVLLVFGQAVFYVLTLLQSINIDHMVFIPALVLQGEVWRLLTFPFIPVMSNPIFFAFGLYLFYLMGSALESFWGEFRFNLYVLIGYLLTVAMACVMPYRAAGNIFIYGSVFLAFAFLNPDFELLLFFFLPVRIKWLALLTWAGYGLTLIAGSWDARLSILASVGNFLIFFWHDLVWLARRGGLRMTTQARGFSASRRDAEPFHRCAVCGATDQTHRDMLFRYCKECEGTPGYCEEHYAQHEHVKKNAAEAAE